MHLTAAQLQTLGTYIASVPAWAALPNDSTNAQFIAGELSKPASPTFIVWRTNVGAGEIGEAWVGTDIDGMTSVNLQRLQLMLASSAGGTFNMARADRRAGFENPFGTSVNNPSRVAMRAVWKRQANVVEKLFATGTGTDAAPGVMLVEGNIDYDDVQSARSL